MKSPLITIFLFVAFGVCAQGNKKDLWNTFWQLTTEDYIYIFYDESNVYELTDYTSAGYPEGGITLSSNIYGFYETCELPGIDSLKQSGNYYFEISPEENIKGDGFVAYANDCGELKIYLKGSKTMMNIYYSSSQQFVTYMKIDALPTKILRYLKEKGVDVSKMSKD